MSKKPKMIKFDGFESTICPHGKAIIQCGECFNPELVKDGTDWKIKLFHPIWTYRMRKSFKEAQNETN